MNNKKKSVLIIGSGQQAFKYYNMLSKQYNVFISSASNRIQSRKSVNFINFDDVAANRYDYGIVSGSENDRLKSITTLLQTTNDILLEKPASTCIDELEELIQIGKNCNIRVALNRRFFHDLTQLETFIKKSKLLGGVILDQQSACDFSNRRLKQFNAKLTVANSIHSIDLLNYIVNITGNSLSDVTNVSKTTGMFHADFLCKSGIKFNYICSKIGPGPWSLYLYYDNYILQFPNHEEYVLKDKKRNIILTSKMRKVNTFDDISGVWDAFVKKDTRLPGIEESLILHKLCLEIDNG